MNFRPFLAFLIAPFAGSAALVSFMYIYQLWRFGSVGMPFDNGLLGHILLGAFFMYFLTAIFVLPVYLYLVHKKVFSFKTILVVGLNVGIIVPVLSSIWGRLQGDSESLPWQASVLFGLVGLFTSFIFYLVHGQINIQDARPSE